MALSKIPGFVGYEATRVSSFDGRAIGKLTDTNHLYSMHNLEPNDYDKKIITLYTQTAMYNNDFLQMINKSTPYYLTTNSDYWKWDIGVPYQYPMIVEIPQSTLALSKPGIDGSTFQLVLDRKAFFQNDVVTSDRRYGQAFYVVEDPQPWQSGFLYTFQLVTANPLTDYVAPVWLQIGLNLLRIDNAIGEFDEKLSGLPELGQKITLYESLSSAYGFEHTITKWADQRTMKNAQGKPLDIMVYAKYRNNEMARPEVLDMRWEPFVESQMRKAMMDVKVHRMIWGRGGLVNTGGKFQELKKTVEGLYQKMRNNGNLVQYNRGDFSINIMRNVFGDLFYRRVGIGERRVKVYTNEAGIEVFRQALKKDMLNSGLTIIADDRFIDGRNQHMTVNYAFESAVTLETGKIDMVHLKELDEPQTNTEYGQNKKSAPIFLVFDITPDSDGTMVNNIREVRHEGAPSMTWGYIDGRAHHLGFAASQGMSSSNMFPGYKMWMEDRCDLFVEDLSRTVLIEELPLD